MLPHKKKYDLLLDTGFSLGIAFPKTLLPQFRFTDGFLSTMVLADERTVSAFTFLVDLSVVEQENSQLVRNLGQVSCVFMNGAVETVAGIELMKLLSPLTLDWDKSLITSKLG